MPIIIDQEHISILNEPSHLLITGGPGSGKTTIALQKALKYIDDKKLQPGQKVLFLSFSRAAVGRINETADLIVNKKDFQKSLSIQTFHSFFWEVIKTHGYLLGIPKKLRVHPPHDQETSLHGRKSNDLFWLQERNDLLFKEGKMCFDLFAETSLNIFLRSQSIRSLYGRKYPLIIIDEAQDTDAQQWQCVKIFSSHSQIVLLADLDQQIHDYREDVTPERINDIIQELKPIQIPLGNSNHRSGATEIAIFARDVLNNKPRSEKYIGVSLMSYPPNAQRRDLNIRQSVGIIKAQLKKILGHEPESIAILCTWSRGARIVSNALRGSSNSYEIVHRIHFDENTTYLSSRIVAFLLEPKLITHVFSNSAEVLDLISNLFRSKGQTSEWEKYERWSATVRLGNLPRGSTVVPEIKRIVELLSSSRLSGNPEKDWLLVKNLLLTSTNASVRSIGKNVEFLMAFNRGRLISKGLNRKWEETGTYKDAREILDAAIIETQIISENKNQNGINVMTIHKAKGKEFDGVILFDNPHASPFIARGDSGKYLRSRKLLLVGITRAKYYTLILSDASQQCPILDGFNL